MLLQETGSRALAFLKVCLLLRPYRHRIWIKFIQLLDRGGFFEFRLTAELVLRVLQSVDLFRVTTEA